MPFFDFPNLNIDTSSGKRKQCCMQYSQFAHKAKKINNKNERKAGRRQTSDSET